MYASIFLEFHLPNATTWFYFSALLAVAIYFKFNRIASVRNLDVLTLFGLVPGLLLVQEGHESKRAAKPLGDVRAAALVLPDASGASDVAAGWIDAAGRARVASAERRVWWGYFALMIGSTYWLIRCALDPVMVRRPVLAPNLNAAGMVWLAGTLVISLAAVSIRRPIEAPVGAPHAVIAEAQKQATDLVGRAAPTDPREVRAWVERGTAGACHLAVVIGLVVIGARHFGDAQAGTAAATAYLLLPYIAFHITQVHHVLPAALLVWAVAAYKRPGLAGLLVGIAAGGFVFPALTLPVWLGFFWGRGVRRFVRWALIGAAACVVLTAVVLLTQGRLAGALPWAELDWRVWRANGLEGFWAGVPWAYRIPVFVAYAAFVGVTAFWPMPKHLGHLLALSAANLIGLQLWYADQGGVYVLWYLPLVLLLVFRPNLSDRRPPELTIEERKRAAALRAGWLRHWRLPGFSFARAGTP